MRRLRKRTVVVCAGTAVVLSAFLLLRVRDLHYDGRTLTQWLLLIDEGPISSHGNPNAYADQDRAVEVVRILGTNCVPTLIGLIRARDSKAKIHFKRRLSKQSLVSFYLPKAERLNTAGLRGFQVLTTNAHSAIPALLQACNTGDEHLRDCASVALKYAGYSDEDR
jgi:hypothetical protein